jgi:sugar phosphate isomerase/epimerase
MPNRLNLCYSTLRWREPDLEPALEALKAVGWDGWEGRLDLDWLGPPARLRRICDNAGMPLVVYTASGSPDRRDWEHVERNRRRMEYAAELGVDCFMFMNQAKSPQAPVSEDDIKAAAEGAEEWASYAADLGLELSYHIHTNTLVDCVEDWRLYMSHLQRAKLCIDVSHALLWGYDPVQAISDFSSQLNYIHLQDYSTTSTAADGTHLPVWCDVGDGESVDFPAVLQILTQIGFSRTVTACPGEPVAGAEDPLSEARRSRKTRDYLAELGF